MAIEVWMIGKTKAGYLEEGIAEYQKRLDRLGKVRSKVIPDVKRAGSLSPTELKKQEAQLIIDQLKPTDHLVLLDEKGKSYTSRKFAQWIEQRQVQSSQRTVLLIGGAFGFDEQLYNRANQKLSISDMTFSHQLIRLILWEQL